MLLQMSTRSFNDVMVVKCSGRIVVGEETAFLRYHVRDLLDESSHVILDLAEVSYIDSTGVGTLVGLYAAATNAGVSIQLAGLTGKVKDVLQITKLVTVFETFPTVEEAMSHATLHAKSA